MKPTVKILVAYHKPAVLLKNEVLVPIHLGRALATQASKDGAMSDTDYQWMLDNMIGDDTGDNISALNRELNEMTAFYWAWKNYDKLGNPDYIGFMHYRRHLDFTSTTKPLLYTRSYVGNPNKYIDEMGLTEQQIIPILKETDMIISGRQTLPQTVGAQFENLKRIGYELNPNIWYKALATIKKEFPSYTSISNEFIQQYQHFWFNCGVMKKEIFFDLCNFLFAFALPFLKTLDLQQESIQGQRVVGYIMERLYGLFIYKDIKENKRIKDIPLCYIENTDIAQPLKPAFESNNIACFLSCDNNYAMYAGVLIESIIQHAAPKNNYDLIILEETLSPENKQKLVALKNGLENISIRFYNISSYMRGHNFHVSAHFTIATYYRLFAPSIFSNYEKIIYLDVDTILLDDIAQLYNTNLEANLLAAAQDYGVIAKIKVGKWEPLSYFQQTLGIKNPFSEYFQAGVLIFNIRRMNELKIEQQCIDVASKNKYAYVDQDVLNRVCYGKIKTLDSAWNVNSNSGTKKDLMKVIPAPLYNKYRHDRKAPHLIHYASFTKPWNYPSMDFASVWWQYARQTPFYEELLMRTTNFHVRQSIKKIEGKVAYMQRKSIFWDYYRCKILSKITWGNKRKHYKQKRDKLHEQVRKIRTFLK